MLLILIEKDTHACIHISLNIINSESYADKQCVQKNKVECSSDIILMHKHDQQNCYVFMFIVKGRILSIMPRGHESAFYTFERKKTHHPINNVKYAGGSDDDIGLVIYCQFVKVALQAMPKITIKIYFVVKLFRLRTFTNSRSKLNSF